MEKRILIIGNDNGLPGVKVDIDNYKKFFQSPYGGDWYPYEIIEKLNPTKSDLTSTVNNLRSSSLDYLIVIFSGHGGNEKRDTLLEINPQYEFIPEALLRGICGKQLNIYDCCRAVAENIRESVVNQLKVKLSSVISTRYKFEEKISSAIPQQVLLWACSIGESAHDTSKGGAYSQNLITRSISKLDEFTYVGVAHQLAASDTTREFPDQKPDADLPKCLTSQQLIIGIRG